MSAHKQIRVTTLADLFPELDLEQAKATPIRNLCLDSRNLHQGDVFVALTGTKIDGRNFVAQAIEAGVAGILVEAGKNWRGIAWVGHVPVIAIEDLAGKISAIAGHFYNQPSRQLKLIGVTGTNGKTTCTLLIAQLCALLQQKAAVIGTIGYGLLDPHSIAPITQQINLLTATGLTTPDPVSLQSILNSLKNEGAMSVALEVSSHSLHQKRVAGLEFHTAIFTNLTQDHLDYHGDLTRYGNTKAQLLHMPKLRYAIVNADDNWASSLLPQVPPGVDALSYSINQPADIYADNIRLHAQGINARVVTPWGTGDIHSPLLGAFNLSNLLAAIAALGVQGYTLKQLLPLIPQLESAPGRMQTVVVDASQQEIQVIVDYAHTPDALDNTLKALHEHKPGRVWTVFGCGGDRDKTKRPLMGRIAERQSDYVIVTNDNPRSEDPATIAAEIVRGMNNPNGCLVIAERAQAIDFAIQQAKPGDIVLIAGKGHEDYQIFAAQTLPFSDTKQARLALQRRIAKHEANRDTKEVHL